jgi:dihydrolipoamide dehydrogenase
MELKPTILVLGGGPGGYVAAIRAVQLGLDTVLVEAERLGGTCLNVGCIPSKSLIHAASQFDFIRQANQKASFGICVGKPTLDLAQTMVWKDSIVARLNEGVGTLLKRAKVKVIKGWGTFTDAKTCTVQSSEGTVTIKPTHVILAAGSTPTALPFLPFGPDILSSTDALALPSVPARLSVVGGGYIGLELGIAYRKLGSAVTIIEAQERVLAQYDRDLVAPVEEYMKTAGVEVHVNTNAKSFADGTLTVETASGLKNIVSDKVLVTVGRRPNTQGWGLESMGVDMNGAFVKVDERCATSMRNVWAIGDLVGEPMLEHKAAAQGHLVAEIIAGHAKRFNPVAIPAVCFTDPEIVTVGLSPADAEKGHLDVIVSTFPFAANGRSLSVDAGAGFVRIVARKDNHRVLGIQAVGEHVSELSAAFVLAVEMGAVLEDIAGTIHVHPTVSEAFHEAALRGLGHAIHI